MKQLFASVLFFVLIGSVSHLSAARPDEALLPMQVFRPVPEKYTADQRTWQGIPSMTVAPNGRLWATWYSGGNVEGPDNIVLFLSLFSMIGLLLTIVIINAAGRDHLLKIGVFLIFACLLHNLLGFLFGYWLAHLFGLDERSCRTVSTEVGLQNGGLASGLALQMGKAATVGLAPAVFGPLMNITGSSLATWWRSRPVAQNCG